MSCCSDKFGNQTYIPINKRLLKFGEESTDKSILEKFSDTKLWIFSFFDEKDASCADCMEKLKSMLEWFEKYNILKNPINNVKWIFEQNAKNNLIYNDLFVKKTPLHIITDSNGNIIDMVFGFPDDNWLKTYLLPLINN